MSIIFEHHAELIIFWLVTLAFVVPSMIWWYADYKKRQRDRDWYRVGSALIPGSPPAWVFGFIWAMLYVCIAISMFMFYRSFSTRDKLGVEFDVGGIFYGITYILLQAWYPTFFRSKRFGLAMLEILMLIISGAVILAMLALDADDNAWIAFGFFLPYEMWLVYAMYLNAYWVWVYGSGTMPTDIENRGESARFVKSK